MLVGFGLNQQEVKSSTKTSIKCELSNKLQKIDKLSNQNFLLYITRLK